jgi:hypothetical protein
MAFPLLLLSSSLMMHNYQLKLEGLSNPEFQLLGSTFKLLIFFINLAIGNCNQKQKTYLLMPIYDWLHLNAEILDEHAHDRFLLQMIEFEKPN